VLLDLRVHLRGVGGLHHLGNLVIARRCGNDGGGHGGQAAHGLERRHVVAQADGHAAAAGAALRLEVLLDLRVHLRGVGGLHHLGNHLFLGRWGGHGRVERRHGLEGRHVVAQADGDAAAGGLVGTLALVRQEGLHGFVQLRGVVPFQRRLQVFLVHNQRGGRLLGLESHKLGQSAHGFEGVQVVAQADGHAALSLALVSRQLLDFCVELLPVVLLQTLLGLVIDLHRLACCRTVSRCGISRVDFLGGTRGFCRGRLG